MEATTAGKLKQLRENLAVAREPAGAAGIAKRAAKGIRSPRERIAMLLDPGSFVEIGALVRQPGAPDSLYGDGVVTGHGTIDGRPAVVIAHDQTVFGGSVGEMFGRMVAGGRGGWAPARRAGGGGVGPPTPVPGGGGKDKRGGGGGGAGPTPAGERPPRPPGSVRSGPTA